MREAALASRAETTTRLQAEAAARCARESLDGHPASRARRRAIGYVLLATAQVQQREIELACSTGLKAVELLDGLRSNRITEAVLASAASGEWVDVATAPEAVAN